MVDSHLAWLRSPAVGWSDLKQGLACGPRRRDDPRPWVPTDAQSPGFISDTAHYQKGGQTLRKTLSPAVAVVIILVVVIIVAVLGYFVFFRPKGGAAPEIPAVDTAPAGQTTEPPPVGNVVPPPGKGGG
jgi:hypothetical protein